MVNNTKKSKVIFCTVNLPLAKLIRWFTGGYAHAALILPNGNWLDARFSGVRERHPEEDLYEFEIVELPFDIEPAFRKFIGEGYNFRGVMAQWLHMRRWRSKGRLFCDQAILSACRKSGHPIINEVREEKVSPQICCDLLKAYLKGMSYEKGKNNER